MKTSFKLNDKVSIQGIEHIIMSDKHKKQFWLSNPNGSDYQVFKNLDLNLHDFHQDILGYSACAKSLKDLKKVYNALISYNSETTTVKITQEKNIKKIKIETFKLPIKWCVNIDFNEVIEYLKGLTDDISDVYSYNVLVMEQDKWSIRNITNEKLPIKLTKKQFIELVYNSWKIEKELDKNINKTKMLGRPMENDSNKNYFETPHAKLRNALTPAYSLAGIVLMIDENPDLKSTLDETSKQCLANKDLINSLLQEIESTIPNEKKIDKVSGYKFKLDKYKHAALKICGMNMFLSDSHFDFQYNSQIHRQLFDLGLIDIWCNELE